MGKFDGMDPKLVRELLAEVKHAAGELRSLEGRVTHVMSAAGLPTQTTHRPVQVADAVDTMVHDVSQRLALLEKKNDSSPVVGGDKPTSEQQTPSDHKTPTDDQPKQTNDQPKPSDDQPKHSGEQAVSGHKTGETADQPKTPDTGTDQPKTPDNTDQPKTPDTGTDQPKTPDTGTDQSKTPDTGADQPKSTESDAKTPQLDPHKPHVVVVDGVKVLQVPIDPPTATELNDLIKNIDKVQPHDLPAATTHPSQVEPGDARPWVNDGSDVVSVNAKPISPEALKDLIDHIRDVPPMDMPSVDVPKGEWGHGEWTPKHIQPDGPPGTVDPGQPSHPAPAPGSTDSSTTATSGTPAGGADPVSGGVHGPGAGGAGGAEAAGVNPYADDGSDVVSVNAKPLDPEALKTLHDHAREVQPLDMPGVEVPKGEWGKGEWVPKDIQPDGPPGTIDPGAPERSA